MQDEILVLENIKCSFEGTSRILTLLSGIFQHRRNHRKCRKFLPFLQNYMGFQINILT